MGAMSERVKINRRQGSWSIWCDICASGERTWILSGPWLTAKDHHTALIAARWHVDEHQARACEHCHRSDPLSRANPIDATHIEFEGKLYEVRSTGVVAIGTAAPKETP